MQFYSLFAGKNSPKFTKDDQLHNLSLNLRVINWPEDKNKEYGINKFSLYHVPVSHSEQCKKAYKGCMNNIFI